MVPGGCEEGMGLYPKNQFILLYLFYPLLYPLYLLWSFCSSSPFWSFLAFLRLFIWKVSDGRSRNNAVSRPSRTLLPLPSTLPPSFDLLPLPNFCFCVLYNSFFTYSARNTMIFHSVAKFYIICGHRKTRERTLTVHIGCDAKEWDWLYRQKHAWNIKINQEIGERRWEGRGGRRKRKKTYPPQHVPMSYPLKHNPAKTTKATAEAPAINNTTFKNPSNDKK